MVRSMTGFGVGNAGQGPRTVTAEARSTNHRFLKVSIHSPRILEGASPAIEALVKSKCSRGAIDVSVKWSAETTTSFVRLDAAVLKARLDELTSIYASVGATASQGELMAQALRLPGAIGTDASGTPDEALLRLAEEAASEAIKALLKARETEGTALARILEEGVVDLEKTCAQFEQRASAAVREARDRMVTRVNALLNEVRPLLVINDELLLREASIAADRADIAEEVSRLRTHIAHFRTVLHEGKDTGRRLDFLLQEMLREVNTTGSKSSDTSMAHAVVEAKTAIERLKEQVANVE